MTHAVGAGAVALWLLAYAPNGIAADILKSEVQHRDGVYRVRFAVRVHAPVNAVRALMTDYARLSRLSKVVTGAEIVRRFGDGTQRLRLNLRACVWIFCKDLRKLQDVTTRANGDIDTIALPAESDFRHAVERWRIVPEANDGNYANAANPAHTRIEYESELTPSFFVPPFIGPALIKRALRRELTHSIETLERLAA